MVAALRPERLGVMSELQDSPWARKHDLPGAPLVPAAPRIVYPQTLDELVHLCATHDPGERLHAAGSHWALSTAAVSDSIFIETHDPNDRYPAMGRTLREVVPGCLSPDFIGWLNAQDVPAYDEGTVNHGAGLYPVHMEAGKRVYQAYAELDLGDDHDDQSLAHLLAQPPYDNPAYLGPWAFRTLGGAGGQTVFGALTTGTHGGDFRQGPIADGVIAMHLVTDGGDHYWIERLAQDGAPPMTDDAPLQALYGHVGGPGRFHIRRDRDLFNAVLVNPGRFGVVYSFVYGAVRQYTLHQDRMLADWQDVVDDVTRPGSPLFTQLYPAAPATGEQQKFLQIAVCLTTHDNFTRNLVGVTRRWDRALVRDVDPPYEPIGRNARRGAVEDPFDPQIGAPRFTRAGRAFGYAPDDAEPGSAADPSFLEQACTNADFFVGVLEQVAEEIRELIEENTVPIGGAIAAVAVVAGVGTLLTLLAALAVLLVILLAVIAALRAESGPRLGNALNLVRESLLNRTDPLERAAGILIWQAISYELFRSQQGNQIYDAISYAVMDGHNYRDRSCNVNVRSVEVFFDATDEILPVYIDQLIRFETLQEFQGRAFVGYVSLRFVSESRGLIAPARWPLTCVVEVAGLADVMGSTELVDYAEQLALDPNINGLLHWGQQHNGTARHVQRWFGDSSITPSGRLGRWRRALAEVTANGRLDGFSSRFTRQTGLEVVKPQPGRIDVVPVAPATGDDVDVRWDCTDNPAGTTAQLYVVAADGTLVENAPVAVRGSTQVNVFVAGSWGVTVVLTYTAFGETRMHAAHTSFTVT